MDTWDEGLAARVVDCLHLYQLDRFDSALSLACVAVDGTSRRVYADMRSAARYKKFVRDNMCALFTSPLGIVSPCIRIGFRHPRVNLDNDGFADRVDVLYHVVRCGLLHESSLGDTLRLVPNIAIAVEREGTRLLVGPEIVVGLIAAVIGSPANANVKTRTGLRLGVGQFHVSLDQAWGMGEMLCALFTAPRLGGP